MNHRLIRLYNDYREVSGMLSGHPYIEIRDVMGNPPERYLIAYKVRGLIQQGDDIVERDTHLCEIILTGDYPSHEPVCRLISMAVFHPNIAPNKICIADHWAAGESLTNVIIRIGEMISYQNYNVKSPLNGEAAKWAQDNLRLFPVDDVNLTPERSPGDATPGDMAGGIGMKSDPEILAPSFLPMSCTNCGVKEDAAAIVRCVNGHQVCTDCLVHCTQCGREMCVLCGVVKCTVCGKIVCENCMTTCRDCGSVVCHDHSHRCSVCRSPMCNKCLAVCSVCSAGQEPSSHPVVNDTPSVTPPGVPLPEVAHHPTQTVAESGSRCRHCDAVVEDRNAKFCVMCGGRIGL